MFSSVLLCAFCQSPHFFSAALASVVSEMNAYFAVEARHEQFLMVLYWFIVHSVFHGAKYLRERFFDGTVLVDSSVLTGMVT